MFKYFPENDHLQRLRLQRVFLMQAGGAIHTLLCLIALLLGYFRGGWPVFLIIFSLAWSVHLTFAVLVRAGWNKSFKDPSLTLAQITWATLVVMATVYCLSELRMVVLMYYLLVIFFAAFSLSKLGFAYITILAVTCYGGVIGLLALYYPDSVNFTVEVVRWVGFAVSMTAFSFVGADLSELRRRVSRQNHDLREALATIRGLAITDELTGLCNRRHIMGVLQYQKSLADRGRHSFVLAFADLDHFKKVNDLHGHQAGDEVLKRFAQIAKGSIREVDYAARYGGEEFVMVLVQTGLPEAVKIAERIRTQVEEETFLKKEGVEIKITVSLGLTQYRPKESVEEALARADDALYAAKQEGRNRVVVRPPAEGGPPA
ncbi:hypothetical protein AAU61_18920 [Desulfocarbo indianensis]|nr:hypothetical protein AAU61_18920 [Desulfocarbo indianensis]